MDYKVVSLLLKQVKGIYLKKQLSLCQRKNMQQQQKLKEIGTKKGKQFVKQPTKIAKKVKKYRVA
jgi:hypothetical protein